MPQTQPVIDRGAVADAAAELDFQIDRPADRPHRLAIHRLAGEGAVEIDDVQPAEPRIGEVARLRRRVVVEHGGARHLAAHQPHAGAALQVDRGEQDHGVVIGAGSSSRL